ncbi:hypothetical protein LINGRAHAP2_LOCUS31496 [Linum grandiflorum]
MEFGTAASGLLCWFHTTLLIRLWSYRGLTIRRWSSAAAPPPPSSPPALRRHQSPPPGPRPPE